jgi:adenylate kinase
LAPRSLIPWPAFLLVGPTGSGKTPLGDEIERRGLRGRRCVHFDFGATLRALASLPAGESGLTPRERAVIRRSLATGALFEAEDMPMIAKILRRYVARRRLTNGSLLVLNGLPRHRSQAESLASIVEVVRIVSLEAGPAVIRKRMRLDTGRDRAGRADDNLEAVAARLAIFKERTAPILEYYREQGVPVTTIRVTAKMTPGEMYDRVDRTIAGDRGRA